MSIPKRNVPRIRAFNLGYRKHIVIPTEHGSWPWMLVPFFVGAGVAGQFNLAGMLTLVGGLAVFLLRQPATIWLRVRRGKARAADGPIASAWITLFTSVALVCFIVLIILERGALLILVWPFLVIFGLYLAAARYGRSGRQSLWMELAGAAALSMMAPAAAIAANGQIQGWEWSLWAVMAAQNVLGALYARLRVFDSHNRPINRQSIFAVHLAGLLLVGGLAWAGNVPGLTAVPFAGFFLRAGWATSAPRPAANIKRLGFTELGIEIISGLWIVASYWLS